MVCYPSKDKFGPPNEEKFERPEPSVPIDMDFVVKCLFNTQPHLKTTNI